MTAVVPVKPLRAAKTRLALPTVQRRSLALAFALDTIAALQASARIGEVLVVTADPDVVRRLRPLGVVLVPESGTGLRAAVADGVEAATATRPDAGVVVVPADLPCLRPEDVTRVLTSGAGPAGAFVPDLPGTGTTMLIHPPGRVVPTCYGPGSAAGHRALGLRRLTDAPIGARRDVDTAADLRAAEALGTGPETAAVLDLLVGLEDRSVS